MNIDLEGKLNGLTVNPSPVLSALLATLPRYDPAIQSVLNRWRQTAEQKAAIRAKWAALPKGSVLVFDKQGRCEWITPLKLSA